MADNSRPQWSRYHNYPRQAQPKTMRDLTTESRLETKAVESSDEECLVQV